MKYWILTNRPDTPFFDTFYHLHLFSRIQLIKTKNIPQYKYTGTGPNLMNLSYVAEPVVGSSNSLNSVASVLHTSQLIYEAHYQTYPWKCLTHWIMISVQSSLLLRNTVVPKHT